MEPGEVSIRRLTDDRMRHGGDGGCGKDADRKIGGPLACFFLALQLLGWYTFCNRESETDEGLGRS
jgi:hypothetical protein